MTASFYRSGRALRADGASLTIAGLAMGIALLCAWVTWSFRARITRYEVADSARLEIDRAVSPIQTRVAGRVRFAALALGQEVHPGDILVELETDSERLSLEEEHTRLRTLGPQLDALKAESGVQDQGRTEERGVLSVAEEEARARFREAEALARQADRDAERARLLRAEKVLSEADFQKAQADAASKHAAAESLGLAVSRLGPEQRVRETDREARMKQILSDSSKLEAQVATSTAAIHRLEYEIERRRIRAPVAGRLAECAVLRKGTYVAEGEKLGVILPGGGLRVVADFPPAAALGRVRPGQPATVRLQGFPWAQYGTIPARVSSVAGEIRDGHVRVELAVLNRARSSIPLQHGLPGSVEVEVERVSPAELALRSAGQTLSVH